MRKIGLHWQILMGIIGAVLFGMFLPDYVHYVSWMGTVFIRGLKMIVVPLVLSSLVCGVINIGSNGIGRIGLKALIYYISTSLLAIFTGLIFVNLIKPGAGRGSLLAQHAGAIDLVPKPLSDTLIEMVPDNIFSALSANDAMLSVILFALMAGIFISQLKPAHRSTLTGLFEAFFELMMKITLFVIRLAPLGVFGLVAVVVANQSNTGALFSSLGMYMVTVILGLLFHSLVSLPLVLFFIGRVNPIDHYKAMLTPLLTAFTTASSNATLPITIEAIEEKAGVSNHISSFTLPLGATINMDGTALYELVVVGFVAQLYGIDLSFGQQFIIVVTALLSSIGTAGVPMASLVTMTIIFTAVGIPFEAVALVLPVDRPLDMLRTAVNVLSDTCGAVTIASSEGEIIKVSRKS